MVERTVRAGETIYLDADGVHVPITVSRARGRKLRLSIDAPRFVGVYSGRAWRRKLRGPRPRKAG